MLQHVVGSYIELDVKIRAKLACGHIYTRPLTSKETMKHQYTCYACEQKEMNRRDSGITNSTRNSKARG